jgi:hypothetical protein
MEKSLIFLPLLNGEVFNRSGKNIKDFPLEVAKILKTFPFRSGKNIKDFSI